MRTEQEIAERIEGIKKVNKGRLVIVGHETDAIDELEWVLNVK